MDSVSIKKREHVKLERKSGGGWVGGARRGVGGEGMGVDLVKTLYVYMKFSNKNPTVHRIGTTINNDPNQNIHSTKAGNLCYKQN